jgi:MinD superfamily P-loop ATPase
MQIAVASGKGGTGKTTVATSLATLLARRQERVQLVDVDVEQPNCHLFIQPEIHTSRPVTVGIPKVDQARCDHCGQCSRLCEFGAILTGQDDVLIFPDLCHSCGGCMRICPRDAIEEVPQEVGVLREGTGHGLSFLEGCLTVGHARATPVIAAARQWTHRQSTVIIDAPPGTSCAVIEAIRDVDFLCLVTEPTPFGAHDLALACKLGRTLELAMGIVINRCDIGDDRIHRLAGKEGVPILAEIPNDPMLAKDYSQGNLPLDSSRRMQEELNALASKLLARGAA